MFILYIFVCNVIYHIWKYLYIVFKIFSVTLIKHKYKCIKPHLGEHSRNIWKPILIRGRQIILKPIQIWGRFQNICYHPKLIDCFGCDIRYMCGHILHYLSEKASDRSTYLCISIEYFLPCFRVVILQNWKLWQRCGSLWQKFEFTTGTFFHRLFQDPKTKCVWTRS